MNTFSVSRLALTLAFGVTLTACSSTPPDQRPSDQTAPGTSSRPILSAKEAQNFDAQHYFCIPDTRCGSVESFPDYPACAT